MSRSIEPNCVILPLKMILFLFLLIQINFIYIRSKKSQIQKGKMSSLYKVTKIEGKGLGCVAISDIKKGSLILSEKLQLWVKTEEKEGSSMWIKSLLKSFYQMSKADQHEYMKLHNKFSDIKYLHSEDIRKIEYEVWN